MLSTEIIETIARRAIRDGGVTYDAKGQQFVKKQDQWVFPRWPDLTTIIPEARLKPALMEFVANYSDKLNDKVYLGVWRKQQKYFIDCNAYTASFEDARVLAKAYSKDSQRSIISAYNPAKNVSRYF